MKKKICCFILLMIQTTLRFNRNTKESNNLELVVVIYYSFTPLACYILLSFFSDQMEADLKWLERAGELDLFGSPLHVAAVASPLPSRSEILRSTSFVLDATTPHGDVLLVNENSAVKPATGWVTVHAVEPITHGIHEWSIKIENQGETSDGSGLMLGIVPKVFCRYDSFISQGGGWCLSRAGKFYGHWKRVEGIGSTGTLVFGTGDTVTFELDTETSRMTVAVGDRFVVGEISKLTPEVYPAASLHYRQQHICFESRRKKQKKYPVRGWFQKSLQHQCHVMFKLSHHHLRNRVSQLLSRGLSQRGTERQTEWEDYYLLRQDVLSAIINGVSKLIETPEAHQHSYSHRGIVATQGVTPEKVVANCGIQLSLSLLSAVAADNPAVCEAVFETLGRQFQSQPLFSFSPYSPDGSLIPICTLEHLRVAASTHVSPASIKLLVIIALLRSDATECLRTLKTLVDLPPASQNFAVDVSDMFCRLQRALAPYDLPILRYSDEVDKIDIRLAVCHCPSSVWGSSPRPDRFVVKSIASNVNYLFIAIVSVGIIKLGHGRGCIPTDVLAKNDEIPGNVTLAYVNGNLYVRPTLECRSGIFANKDLIVLDPVNLSIKGFIKADGFGSIETCDVRHTPLALQEGSKIESRIFTDGVYLYLASAHPKRTLKDEGGSLLHPPTSSLQCRDTSNPVVVTTFDPSNMRVVRSVTLAGPKPSSVEALRGSGGSQRKVLHLDKESYIDLGPIPEALQSPFSHMSIELWCKPAGPDDVRNVYVHGDKSCGREVFIDIHCLDNCLIVKGGVRTDVRNGIRSCSTSATMPSCGWVHIALVFDGVWMLYLNGIPSGTSRVEDTSVGCTKQPRRWILGSNFSGSITEVRIWSRARPCALILRDLHFTQSSLSHSESSLITYYPLDEGHGHTIYDWGSSTPKHNAWISKKAAPLWRESPDCPVTSSAHTDCLASSEIEQSMWQIFLPSIENCGMTCNGRVLSVILTEVEELIPQSPPTSGHPQFLRYGLSSTYSLDDGCQIPTIDLLLPIVDGPSHFDRSFNGVWYCCKNQFICWAASRCTVPSPLPDDPCGQITEFGPLTPLQLTSKISEVMSSYALRYASQFWSQLYQPLSVDPTPELFQIASELLATQLPRPIQSKGGRRISVSAVEDSITNSKLVLCCLRLLGTNFKVVQASGADPVSLGLRTESDEGSNDKDHISSVGRLLYSQLLTLIGFKDTPGNETFISTAATIALAEGLPLIYTPTSLIRILKNHLLQGVDVHNEIIVNTICEHISGLKHSIEVVSCFCDVDCGMEELIHFYKLLVEASLACHSFRSSQEGISPVIAVLCSLQSALLGSVATNEKAAGEAIQQLLSVHASILPKMCSITEDLSDDDTLRYVRTSVVGRALGALIMSVPLLVKTNIGVRRYLNLLQQISTSLEDLSKRLKSVANVEYEWDSNWMPASDDPSKAIQQECNFDLPKWFYSIRLTVEFGAAQAAGRMVRGPQKSGSCPTEKNLQKWVDSSLFAGGIRESTNSMRACDEIAEGTEKGMQLWKAVRSDNHSQAQAAEPTAIVYDALRYIFAVLARDLMNSNTDCDDCTQTPSPPQSAEHKQTTQTDVPPPTVPSIPPTLLGKYRKVEGLKNWLIHMQEASDEIDVQPPPLIHSTIPSSGQPMSTIIERCKFILKFHHSPNPTDSKVVLKALVSSGTSGVHKSKKKCFSQTPSSWRSMFNGWRAIKKLQRLLAINQQEDEVLSDQYLVLLLEFLAGNDLQLNSIEEVIHARQETGRIRAEGLQYLKTIIAEKAKPFKLEALRVLASAMSSHHYTDGIASVGPSISATVQRNVYSLLTVLLLPFRESSPPNDTVSQVQCCLVLTLLHCRWDAVDFAFLRSVDLPKILFKLFTYWRSDGTEKEELPPPPTSVNTDGDDQQLKTPQHPQHHNAAVASDLFSACTLKAAMLLALNTNPGIVRASIQFIYQSVDCLCNELHLSIAALRNSPTTSSMHVIHVEYLLTIVSSIIQALNVSGTSPALASAKGDQTGGVQLRKHAESLGVNELFKIFTLCLSTLSNKPDCFMICQYAFCNLRSLLPNLSPEVADAKVSSVLHQTAVGDQSALDVEERQKPPLSDRSTEPQLTPKRVKAGAKAVIELDEPEKTNKPTPGSITIEFVASTAAGTEGSKDAVVAAEAVLLLRQLLLHSQVWQLPVTSWINREFEKDLSKAAKVSLPSNNLQRLALCLDVMCGMGRLLCIREGVQAEYTAGKRSRTVEPVIVTEVNKQTGKAVVIASDLSLGAEDMEVDINNLRVQPSCSWNPGISTSVNPTGITQSLPTALPCFGTSSSENYNFREPSPPTDFEVFSMPQYQKLYIPLLSVAVKYLTQEQDSSGGFCFPKPASTCASFVAISAKLLKCLSLYLAVPSFAVQFLRSDYRKVILQAASILSRSKKYHSGNTECLEGKVQHLQEVILQRWQQGEPTVVNSPAAYPSTEPSEVADDTNAEQSQHQQHVAQLNSKRNGSRRLAAEDLSQILPGFGTLLCMKALEIAKDDKDRAAAILMDNVDEIAAAVEADEALANAATPSASTSVPLEPVLSHFKNNSVRYALSFGPVGTGRLTIPLKENQNTVFNKTHEFTVELTLRIQGEGMFKKQRLHPDITPMLPLRILDAAKVLEVSCCDAFIQVVIQTDSPIVSKQQQQQVDMSSSSSSTSSSGTVSCNIPTSEKSDWFRLVIRCSPHVTEVWGDGKLYALSTMENTNRSIVEELIVGPGLTEPATELHPCVAIEVSSLRIWNSCVSSRQAEALSLKGNDLVSESIVDSHTILNILMVDGSGSSCSSILPSGKLYSAGYLSGGVRWCCSQLPSFIVNDSSLKSATVGDAGESLSNTNPNSNPNINPGSYLLSDSPHTNIDIPRTEWNSSFNNTTAIEKLIQVLCLSGQALCIDLGRALIRVIIENTLSNNRYSLWGMTVEEVGEFYTELSIEESGQNLASTLAFIPELTGCGVKGKSHCLGVQSWLSSNPSSQHIDQFISEALEILEEPPDTYIYETPSHPYVPSDVMLETVEVPGADSYSITFDPRCKTLDYLHFYTNRSQKVQLAKFPDSQGQWTPLLIEKQSSFTLKFSGDAATPSYWGYLMCVTVSTPRFELACDMLSVILQGASKYRQICTATVASLLTAAFHKNVGRRRLKVGMVLANLLGKCCSYFKAYAIPRLEPLLADIRKQGDAQITKEGSAKGGITGVAKSHSRYLQVIAEICVSAEIADRHWLNTKREQWGVAKRNYDEALRRCYLSPAIRPPLTETPLSPTCTLRCASGSNNIVRGKSLLFSDGVWRTVQDTTGVMIGRWYYEVRLLSAEPAYIGWACEAIDTACGECNNSWSICGNRGCKYHSGERSVYPTSFTDLQVPKWKGRDIVGVMLDLYARTLEYTLNGKPLGIAYSKLPSVFYFPTITVGNCSVEVNFGETVFAQAPPPGFLPLHGGTPCPPGVPIYRLLSFVDSCDALLQSKTLPGFYKGLEVQDDPPKGTRDGTDFMEVQVLDGRPKIDHLTTVRSTAAACTVRGTARVTDSGKWYYETTLSSDGLMQLGWLSSTSINSTMRGIGDDTKSWAYDGCRLLVRHRKEHTQIKGSHIWREGDIVGCLLDLDNGIIRFSLNGDLLHCAIPSQPNSTATTTSDAFSSINTSEWYSPGVSMDPENCISFNFGSTSFVYKPAGYRGIGLPWGVLSALDSSSTEQLPDSLPFKNTLESDQVIVRTVNSLCHIHRQNLFSLKLDELVTPSNFPETLSGDVSSEDLISRVQVLRNFNQLYRLLFPYLNIGCDSLNKSSEELGVLSSAAKKCKTLLFSTTTTSILQHQVTLANSMVEPVQAKVTLNRRRAQSHRIDPTRDKDGTVSLFGQIYTLLANSSQRDNMFFTTRRFWAVSFQGEGAEDVGGPYRECLAEMCSELMRPSTLPLFITTPNGKNDIGTHRDRMHLNPRICTYLQKSMVYFLGVLMAACMRSNEPLPLYLTPIIWKRLADDPLSPSDIESIDKSALTSLTYLLRLEDEGVTNSMFKEIYEGYFTTEVSSGDDVDLLPGGSTLAVTFENKSQYVLLALQKRLREADNTMADLLEGFYSVLPQHITQMMTASELERLVCGTPAWDVAELKANARYEGLTSEDSRCHYFWSVLEEFNGRDRSLFLRFISGRERAPVRLKIISLEVDKPDLYLPVASTCFFWISLPNYSSIGVLREKLLYAISHCIDIDTDYRVRGSIDENAPPTIGVGEQADDDEFEDYTHLL